MDLLPFDMELGKRGIAWASNTPGLLQAELEHVWEFFPSFYPILLARTVAATGDRTVLLHCSGPHCTGLLTFREGHARCLRCYKPHARDARLAGYVLGLLGTIALDVTARPCKARINPVYLSTVGNRTICSVHPLCIYPWDWPHGNPSCFLNQDFLQDLGVVISEAWHIYPSSYLQELDDHNRFRRSEALGGRPYVKLCLFSSWRENWMIYMVRQRLIPYLYIILLLSDLIKLKQLDNIMQRTGTTVHDFFNLVGRRRGPGAKIDILREEIGSVLDEITLPDGLE